jgi:TolB-like protein/Flp pilus assembly protein TadD
VLAPPADRLDSWKEIAAYLNRGVRTVRRWEREEGLPVHRHVHRVLGSVYAFKSEVDAWRGSGDRRVAPPPVAPVPEHPKSIAVLPFTNLSADVENEYFADGLTDDVTSDLSRVRALRVISRTSSMAFKGTGKGVKAIAGELGVRYVLEGSVRRSGRRLRITAQLIDAAADDHLWAEKYDGTVDDIFLFQERLARMIVEALELRLSTDEERRLAARPIVNLQAYECYVRARQEGWRWRKDAIDRAVRLLRTGLEAVGDNAELYAALGLAHLQYREAGIDVGEGPLREADACARKLDSLGPSSAAGLRLRGWIHYSRGEIQDAVGDLKGALEIDGNNADTLGLLSNCYLISGRIDAARPLIARLLAVDPLTPVNRCMPGWADVLEGNFAAAIDPYRQMFEMDSGNPMARLFYAWILVLNRQAAGLVSIVETMSGEGRETVAGRLTLFLGHALAGRAGEAHALVAPDIQALATATDVFPRILAHGYALAGMPDRAIHWLEIAVARGFRNYPFLAHHDPFFAGLRNEPRFMRLLAAVREQWEAFQA